MIVTVNSSIISIRIIDSALLLYMPSETIFLSLLYLNWKTRKRKKEKKHRKKKNKKKKNKTEDIETNAAKIYQSKFGLCDAFLRNETFTGILTQIHRILKLVVLFIVVYFGL